MKAMLHPLAHPSKCCNTRREKPTPKENEVLVKVYASSVNAAQRC